MIPEIGAIDDPGRGNERQRQGWWRDNGGAADQQQDGQRGDRRGGHRLHLHAGAGGDRGARDERDHARLGVDGGVDVDVVQPDAALVGGITGARRIAIIAEENGVVFTPHTWTNGIGLIANVQLTAGIANAPYIEFPYDPPEWSPARRDFVVRDPLRIDDDGFIVLDDNPGLGFDLNEDVLRETRIGA